MATIPGHELQELADTSRLDLAVSANGHDAADRERTAARLRLLWDQRRFLFRIAGYGLLAATLLAFSIPRRYESTTLLMPPDDQSTSGLAMAATLAGKLSGGPAGRSRGVFGPQRSGERFFWIFLKRSLQGEVIGEIAYKKKYWQPLLHKTPPGPRAKNPL